jgi:hypothetical protein
MRSLSFGVGFGASDLAADASRQHLLIVGHDGTLRGTTLRSDDTPETWTDIGAGYLAADW